MSSKTQKILIITAVVLIVLAAVGVAFLLIPPEKGEGAPADTVHPAEETVYNEDGTVNRVVYYENDVYQGQKDFYTDGQTDYVTYYGADSQPCGLEKTVRNAANKIASYTKKEGDKTVAEDEYIYQEDAETLKKVTKKCYSADGKESAEKLYYAEDGVTVTERFTYIDGVEQTHETFDEKNPYKPENNK